MIGYGSRHVVDPGVTAVDLCEAATRNLMTGMGEKYNGRIRKVDLRTDTPYNTYTRHGLPPTPIALPSQKAIEAAMHPGSSNNIYFVATGNGGHKFSSNLQDHNRAVQEYLSVIRAKN